MATLTAVRHNPRLRASYQRPARGRQATQSRAHGLPAQAPRPLQHPLPKADHVGPHHALTLDTPTQLLTGFGRRRPNLPLPLGEGEERCAPTQVRNPGAVARKTLTPGSSPGQAPTRSHRERGQEPPQLRGRGALCNGLPGEGKEALPQEHTREKDDGSLRGMDSDQSDPPPAVGSWVTASRMMPGACNGFRREASLGPPKCSPRFWPGVQFSPRCVHFFPPTAPNVFTRPAHVFTRSLDGGFEPRRGRLAEAGVISAVAPPWEQGESAPEGRGAGQRSPTRPSAGGAKGAGGPR